MSARRGPPRTKAVKAWPYPRYAAHRGQDVLLGLRPSDVERIVRAEAYLVAEGDRAGEVIDRAEAEDSPRLKSRTGAKLKMKLSTFSESISNATGVPN